MPSELVLVATTEAGRGELVAWCAWWLLLDVPDEPELPQAASTSALASASAARWNGRVMELSWVSCGEMPSPTTTPAARAVLRAEGRANELEQAVKPA